MINIEHHCSVVVFVNRSLCLSEDPSEVFSGHSWITFVSRTTLFEKMNCSIPVPFLFDEKRRRKRGGEIFAN